MNSINSINSINSENAKYFLITIDVEDWFQVENFKPWIPFETWNQRELRVERNVDRLLDLFDSIKLKSNKVVTPTNSINTMNPINESSEAAITHPPSFPTSQLPGSSRASASANTHFPSFPTSQPHEERRPKATFFVLGWLAERLPHMIREIQTRGHEVASHGYNHDLPNSLSPKDLKTDLIDSKKLLEDIIHEAVAGYRGPSFAINDDILKTIADCGYLYDSSYNSFNLHGRYGSISLNGSDCKGIAHRLNENFHELPISNLPLSTLGILAQFRHFRHIHLPWGGGGYFRLIPISMFNSGVKKILRQQDAYVFYAHPWEFDPGQPRVEEASASFKFRHYVNLKGAKSKFEKLIETFSDYRFITCSQYLTELA